MNKIIVSKETLRNFCTLNITWNDISYRLYSNVSPEDIVFDSYYRMTLEDARELFSNIISSKISVMHFFMQWWEPMLLHFYDALYLSDLFGEHSGSIKNVHMKSLPLDEEDMLTWIIKNIYTLYERMDMGIMTTTFAEYSDAENIIRMIDEFEDDNDLPIHERYLTDNLKRDFILEFDNDLILKDSDSYTRMVFKLFTDELCEKKDLTAVRIKGYACYGGNSIYKCDWKTAASCMEILWKEGNFAYAANTLGYIYYQGRLSGGRPDYEKAFFYYSIASVLGVTESSYMLADMFAKGQYVKKNIHMATSMLERLYAENRYRFESGEPDNSFAEVAYRMGMINLIGDDSIDSIAYRFLLQAQFAASLKNGPEDRRLMESINESIGPLFEKMKINKTSFRDDTPNCLYEFTRFHSYSLYELDYKKLKSGKLRMKVTRKNENNYTDSLLTLMTYPMFACCTLTDMVQVTADKVTFDTFEKDSGKILFDYIASTESNGNSIHTFFLKGEPVASVSSDYYTVTNPGKRP